MSTILPSDLTNAVVKATAKELADRLQDGMDDLRLFTLRDVCDRLKVSDKTAKKLLREYVELGEASIRVSPAALRKLISDRTIKTL